MAAIYNTAYDHSTGSVSAEQTSYITVINQPTTTDTTEPTRSQNANMSPNAVTNNLPKASNWPLCRVFLIIVATLVIGVVVGGAVMYIWVPQTCALANSSDDSRNFQGSAENTDVTEALPATLWQNSCPTCPVIPTRTGYIDESPPKDCQEVKDRGNVASGQYMISPQNGDRSYPVYCDMDTDGGGWTVFQRRKDGSVDFFLGWIDYANGFGNVISEHWLGNTKIHHITAQGHYELRIDMADFDGNTAYAKYDYFRLGNAGTQYKLILGSYRGDADDSLTGHDNQSFSTKDRDNDVNDVANCANAYKGGWWYTDCHSSNLNGFYLGGPHESYADGINWLSWKGLHYSLKHVEMKIRIAP